MGRGLYGQSEGNETRSAFDSLNERIADNEIVEGSHVAHLRRLLKAKNWNALNRLVDELRSSGFKANRIDSMLTRAGAGVRL